MVHFGVIFLCEAPPFLLLCLVVVPLLLPRPRGFLLDPSAPDPQLGRLLFYGKRLLRSCVPGGLPERARFSWPTRLSKTHHSCPFAPGKLEDHMGAPPGADTLFLSDVTG